MVRRRWDGCHNRGTHRGWRKHGEAPSPNKGMREQADRKPEWLRECFIEKELEPPLKHREGGSPAVHGLWGCSWLYMDQRAHALSVRASVTPSLCPRLILMEAFQEFWLWCVPRASGREWWVILVISSLNFKYSWKGLASGWYVASQWGYIFSDAGWGLAQVRCEIPVALRSFIPRPDDFHKPYRLNTSGSSAYKNGPIPSPFKRNSLCDLLDKSSFWASVSSSIIWNLQRGSEMTYMSDVLLFSIHTSRTDILNQLLHALLLNPNRASESFLHTAPCSCCQIKPSCFPWFLMLLLVLTFCF